MRNTAPASGQSRWADVVLAAVAIAVFTGQCYFFFAPRLPASAEGIPGADKVGHLGSFALLAFVLAAVAARRIRPLTRATWLLLAGCLMAWAVLSEVIQLFLPARSFDWLDLAADGLGILSGLVAGRLVAGRAIGRAGNDPSR